MENVSVQLCTESDFTERQDLTQKKSDRWRVNVPGITPTLTSQLGCRYNGVDTTMTDGHEFVGM
jgi:hypothetical protein